MNPIFEPMEADRRPEPKSGRVPRWRQSCEEIFPKAVDFLLWGPKIVGRNPQGLCQAEQFKVRNPPQLRFNFGERFAAQVPSPATASRSQHGLGQPLLAAQLADLRADDVSRIVHVPRTEQEGKKRWPRQTFGIPNVFRLPPEKEQSSIRQ